MTNNPPEQNKQVSDCCGAEIYRPQPFGCPDFYKCAKCISPCTPVPTPTHQQEAAKFVECDDCAKKPGTPLLCGVCLKRRDIFEQEAAGKFCVNPNCDGDLKIVPGGHLHPEENECGMCGHGKKGCGCPCHEKREAAGKEDWEVVLMTYEHSPRPLINFIRSKLSQEYRKGYEDGHNLTLDKAMAVRDIAIREGRVAAIDECIAAVKEGFNPFSEKADILNALEQLKGRAEDTK